MKKEAPINWLAAAFVTNSAVSPTESDTTYMIEPFVHSHPFCKPPNSFHQLKQQKLLLYSFL